MIDEDILFIELEAAVKKEFEAHLPHGWVLSQSKNHGRMYYFNKITGESRWFHPLIPNDDKVSIKTQLLTMIKIKFSLKNYNVYGVPIYLIAILLPILRMNARVSILKILHLYIILKLLIILYKILLLNKQRSQKLSKDCCGTRRKYHACLSRNTWHVTSRPYDLTGSKPCVEVFALKSTNSFDVLLNLPCGLTVQFTRNEHFQGFSKEYI